MLRLDLLILRILVNACDTPFSPRILPDGIFGWLTIRHIVDPIKGYLPRFIWLYQYPNSVLWEITRHQV
jgi:hypothetical protein